MQEFAAILVSFAIIPLLSRKKVPIGIAIIICALVMALLTGLGPAEMLQVITGTVLVPAKLYQLIIVSEISIIGVLLKQYKIMDKVLEHLLKLIHSRRLILMSVPALIGMLSVPGGAIMSAPLIDELGEGANISKTHRAIINLVYRHIAMNIMPYATGFLLVLALAPQVDLYQLVGLNVIFVIQYILAAYLIYIRPIPENDAAREKFEWRHLAQLLKFTSPITVSIFLNLLLGVPFHIGMLANLLMVYLLHPTRHFLADAARAFNFHVLYALIGVYLIQGIVSRMTVLTASLASVLSSPETVLLGIIGISLFFGITTGFQPTVLGIVLPILAGLPLSSGRLLLFVHFTFTWAFFGYFFSPMHLCQLFTCTFMGVKTSDLYKAYWKFIVSLVAILIANYFIMTALIH